MQNHKQTDIDNVRILTRTFDSWVVEFRIAVDELYDQSRLLYHLRMVKQFISKSQSVHESCLAFDGIVRKEVDQDAVDVVVRIRKIAIAAAAPRVHLSEERIDDDAVFSNMHAHLDIHYLDEYEQIVTLDKVMRIIRSAGVSMDLVDVDFVAAKVSEVVETQTALKNIPIAHGKLPGVGTDAEIEFYVQAVADSSDIELMYSTRRVRKGDLICRKFPATESRAEGCNVFGHTLPPRRGHDILLTAGANAILSLDGLDIVAENDGIAVIAKVSRQIRVGRTFREIPDSVSVRVDPILKVSGDSVADITTSHAVEISGNLKVGTKILAGGEVFISGDVETGASITSSDNILVKGSIHQAFLSSQSEITAGKSVVGSELHAQGSIVVAGDFINSTADGLSVKARSVSGSRIVARKDVVLDRIDADENNVLTTICVGMSDFFLQRLRENRKFLEAAHSNLERIRLVIGDDIFDSITASNTHTMLMRLLSKLRLASNSRVRKQVDVYRKLIEAVPPTQAMILQKERECREIAERMAEQKDSDGGVIVVRERVNARTMTSVNGAQGVIEPSECGTKVTQTAGKLHTTSISNNEPGEIVQQLGKQNESQNHNPIR